MRGVALGAVALVAAVLGGVQFFGAVALRGAAQPVSWPRLLPAPVAAGVDRAAAHLPLPALRLVLARRALESGDVRAASAVALLPASPDRLALEGELARRRGDMPAAVGAYLAAGDLADLQQHVSALARGGDVPGALGLERQIVARLASDRTQPDALAEADFQLGVLEEAAAASAGVRSSARREHERRSEEAYGESVALAPLDERYLLGLGNQQLNRGRLAAAQLTFARARDADPTAAEPLTGFGEVALRRGDVALARRFLARARSLQPASDAVRRLALELGS